MMTRAAKITYSIPEIIQLLILFEVSVILALLVKSNQITDIYSIFPSLSGIILAGVVASLAIIFSSLDSQDLARIYSLNTKSRQQTREQDVAAKTDPFVKFINSAKLDTKIIIFSFSFSIIVLLVGQFDFPLINKVTGLELFGEIITLDLLLRVLLLFDIFMLILSISAVCDIINSLFTLNKTRYSWNSERPQKSKDKQD